MPLTHGFTTCPNMQTFQMHPSCVRYQYKAFLWLCLAPNSALPQWQRVPSVGMDYLSLSLSPLRISHPKAAAAGGLSTAMLIPESYREAVRFVHTDLSRLTETQERGYGLIV